MFRKSLLAVLLSVATSVATSVALASNPTVEIKTNLGVITVEVYPDKTPETSANFLDYVRTGFYDGTIFHRVIDGFMVQGGGFDSGFTQKPTRKPIRNEAASGVRNQPYTVAMARTGDPHSATAQFFINVADNDFLDHRSPTARGYGYAAFGKVIGGREVVDRIAKLKTASGGPFPSDVPVSAVVMEKVRVVGGK